MQESKEIAELLLKLIGEHGLPVAVLVLFAALAIPWVKDYLRERKDERRVDQLLAAKDEIIERLAESDRFWRAYFLKREGRTEDEIEKIMGRPPPKALSSGEQRDDPEEHAVPKAKRKGKR